MTKRQKRLEKLRQNPKNVSKQELEAVLNDFGFTVRSGKGSHVVYHHPDLESPLVIAIHGSTAPTYIVKQVLAAIDGIMENMEEDDENDEDN